MDEEQEILQSSLAQGEKISIDSFFGSPIGGLANRAIMQSNNSLKSSITNRNLIASLQASIELLKNQVRQITNYVLIDRQERNKLIKKRETEAFQREDDIQKGIVSPENAQPRGLEDSLPFFPEARFSQGLTAGMSSIGERQGVAQFQERFVEGSKPFFFGGLVPGSGDADTVDAKLTPGEVVIPKQRVEELGANPLMDFVKGGGLIGALRRKLSGGEKEDVKSDYFVNPEDATNMLDVPTYVRGKDGNFVIKGSEDNEDKRGLLGMIGGSVDAMTGGLTDLDRRGGKPFGLMRGITGTIDAATGGLTDLDRRGGKPFGLMRGITGSIDAMTGGLTDLDRRGGKPFGTMRLATGVADAMTGNLFDFDRRGKGEEMTEGFSTYPSDEGEGKQRFVTRNYEKLLNDALERKKGYEKSGDTKRIEGVNRHINFYNSMLARGITERKIPVTVKPEETTSSTDIKPKETTSSTDIKPKETLGEKFMNIFKGKEMTEGFSTYPSVEPVSENNLKINPSESIKETSQNLMTPPPPPSSETIELPPQIQGDVGGGNGIEGGVSQFKPSTPSYDPLTGTESPLIFVEVISNPFLSIP